MNWKNKIETLSPDTLIESPSPAVYQANEATFFQDGFTVEMYAKILPLIHEQEWSVFAIWQLARLAPNCASILEIGSAHGGSLLTMGLANPTAKLINVDKFAPFDEQSSTALVKGWQECDYLTFRECLGQYPEVFNRVTTILKWSEDAVADASAHGPYDLIYIDGNHSYEYCKRDIELYKPLVKAGGVLAGHDYHPRFDGVIRAVKECFGENYEVKENSSVWWVKL